MDSYDFLPDSEIKPVGEMSEMFLKLNITSFKEACIYVHKMPYGINTNSNDKMILFKDNCGTCSTKHGVIATLAEELKIPLYKYSCVYKYTEEITTGVNEILKKYEVPYIPMGHCFLVYEKYSFDLTEGNNNGKKISIDEYIHAEKVEPFISNVNEYRILKKVLKEKILPSKEMEGITQRSLMKARAEGLILLGNSIKK